MNANNKAEDEQVFETQKDQYIFLSPHDLNEPNHDYQSQHISLQPQLLYAWVRPSAPSHIPFTRLLRKSKPQQPQPLNPLSIHSLKPVKPTAPSVLPQQFSKSFESGNLESATLLADGIYRLTVSMDCHSRKQSQWFYFSCRGLKKARFRIAGFVKPTSLYSEGMKVCVNQCGSWVRGGDDIKYTKDVDGDGYCLEFTYKFKNPNVKTLFAYCFPYTYTDLKNILQDFQKRRLGYLSTSTLTTSLLNHPVPLLTVTSPTSPTSSTKPTLFLSARAHPGQSVSSHIMQGFLEALLSSSQSAQLLRQHYVFRIVPMLNPDGVVLGNYRLSYSGADLNRKWKDTSKRLHKEVYEVKKRLLEWDKQGKIRMAIDIHGHSRKKGVFFYGCDVPGQHAAKVREFPYLMSSLHRSYCYHNCNFSTPKSKQGTLRLSLHRILKLPYVYTLQTSFCGDQASPVASLSQLPPPNYSIQDLNVIGGKLVQGMFLFLAKEMTLNMRISNMSMLQEGLETRAAVLDEMKGDRSLLQVGRQDDEGSESAPSEGCYQEDQIVAMLGLERDKVGDRLARKGNLDRRRFMTEGVTTQYKFEERRQSTNLSQAGTMNCKFRIINGSIFNRKRHKSFDADHTKMSQPSQKQLQVLAQPNVNKGPQYKRVKKISQKFSNFHRFLTFKQQQLDNNEPQPLKLHSAEFIPNTATPSFYPLRKSKKGETPFLMVMNSTKLQKDLKELKQIKEIKESKYKLNISPEKECQKLKIKSSTDVC